MYLAPGPVNDFLDAQAVYYQGIRNQRAMASPRHGLGAHQRHSFLVCRLYEKRHVPREFRGLHVVGVAAE